MVSRETLTQWRAGIKDSWTVGLGVVPLGLAFGLLVTQLGFAWWWAPILSIVIYAGSVEFLALGLITGGASIFSATFTGFMVNFRHIFYGLTYPRNQIKNRWGRIYSTYALTDESYAIVSAHSATAREPMSGPRILAIQIVCQLMWVLSGVAGGLMGTAVPDGIHGMEFALTALFIVLAYDAFKANRDFSLPLSAIVLAIGFALLSPTHMLVLALSSYFLLLLLRFRFVSFDALLTWKGK